MNERKDRILIVDGSSQDLRIHAATLRGEGYEVAIASGRAEAKVAIDEGVPDLLLIARVLADGDGYDLCTELKRDPRLEMVPVVFITDSRAGEDIARCYDCGGVDYIVKPCPLVEFLMRVRQPIRFLHLLREVERLGELNIDNNPLTHLPGNNTIVQMIQQAIDRADDVAVLYTDLDNFKAFNDAYGFNDGDDVILFNAETLQTVLRVVCNDEGFLGHVGGDDFVMIVPSARLEDVGREIAARFDRGVPAFYNDTDIERGYIESEDRKGNSARFPLMTISMGAVPLKQRPFRMHVEVAEVCAEVKHKAKSITGSNLFIDRRLGEGFGVGRRTVGDEAAPVGVEA
ncbi:MAG TPA: diguanylate cyclase [Candidatus Krumholzibacteria bacterium]|nr:diguanylate cyclase [Candidatus Krumholzibacteria bacterium]